MHWFDVLVYAVVGYVLGRVAHDMFNMWRRDRMDRANAARLNAMRARHATLVHSSNQAGRGYGRREP